MLLLVGPAHRLHSMQVFHQRFWVLGARRFPLLLFAHCAPCCLYTSYDTTKLKRRPDNHPRISQGGIYQFSVLSVCLTQSQQGAL